MNAPRIILDSFPSFCQNYKNLWKFDEVLTKIIWHRFLDRVYTLSCQHQTDNNKHKSNNNLTPPEQ